MRFIATIRKSTMAQLFECSLASIKLNICDLFRQKETYFEFTVIKDDVLYLSFGLNYFKSMLMHKVVHI